ncbi:MAG: SAM-dependent methyltransferase [Myxococcota bacterium]
MASRQIHTGDGIAWISAATLGPQQAIVSSLPDVSECRGMEFEAWRRWFIDTSALLCRAVDPSAVTVFYQTDIKREGRWVDKAYLVARGAEEAGASLLFHKIVCRAPPGTITFGRPAYAHLLCFSRGLRLPPAASSADVLPRLGEMTWARAMGVEACAAVARFLLANTECRTVVDPFCGLGTMLAVANAFGLDAIGVERSRKRAARAETLVVAV